MNENQSKKVQKIISDAFDDAEKSKPCINCKHSYFSPEYVIGYCKNEINNKSQTLFPKIIDIYDTCDEWCKKDK
jgi:hypothetical protein